MDSLRGEEKERELELEKKNRDFKIQHSRTKRDEPGVQQPAGKKRRLNKHEYRRVPEEKKEARKRERREDDDEDKPAEKQNYPIFNQKRTKTNPEHDNTN